jgi:hypothetical protein
MSGSKTRGLSVRLTTPALLAILLAASAPARAGSFNYTTIDYGQGTEGTIASGMNAAGMVTGWYVGGSGYAHGFTWLAGTFTSFDAPPGAGDTLPVAINQRGQVVEIFIPEGGGNRMAFLREPNGVQHKLPFPRTVSVQVNAISDHGTIVGNVSASETASPVGFLLADGMVTQLQVPGAITSTADAINDAGTVAGSFTDATGPGGYIYNAGTYTLFRAPHLNTPTVSAIDAAGLVSGAFLDVTHNGLVAVEKGFTFGRNGFHSFNPVWSLNTWIAKAFAPGYYVGTMENPQSYGGFVFRNGQGVEVLPPNAATGYVVGGTAMGAVLGDYRDASGIDHGFIAVCAAAQMPCTQ